MSSEPMLQNAPDTDLERRFRAAANRNPVNAALLARLPALGLPDCWLVAGCLFQAVWNEAVGRFAADGIKDYDVFYFDDSNLSYDAEDAIIQRVTTACADLGVPIEIKNQARVHLWYRDRFGTDYPQLTCARDGIDRFLVAGTCVGIGAGPGNAGDLYAPFGLTDIFSGVLRFNPNLSTGRFDEKAASYRERWPHLHITS